MRVFASYLHKIGIRLLFYGVCENGHCLLILGDLCFDWYESIEIHEILSQGASFVKT